MPIGIQTFEDIRRRNFAYVDKSQYVLKLATEGKFYFLSRPRRFGKSLFLSTLEAYFLGKKDLFTGLALEQLEEDGAKEENRNAWQTYPIIRFDLSGKSYASKDDLQIILNDNMDACLQKYSLKSKSTNIDIKFANLIRDLHDKTGMQVVILVDEYDKPLLETLENEELHEYNRILLKGFFCNLKSQDAHIRFAFLTGVTKFSQVSVFSDLNNLDDITMQKAFSSVCGISQAELVSYFKPEIQVLAEENDYSYEECLDMLKTTYDGYHFAPKSEGVYNPFSLINAFKANEFNYYWFKTGTPSFLIKAIDKYKFDFRDMKDGITASVSDFDEYQFGNKSSIPLLYQAGYLTIKEFDPRFRTYTLKFPNEEVKYGFYSFIMKRTMDLEDKPSSFFIEKFVFDIEKANVDDFMTRMQALVAKIDYSTYGNKDIAHEQTFQTAIFLIFELMGQFTQTEVHSGKGRADCVVWTKDVIYVFEFKLNGTKEEALEQIEDKSYAVQYQADGRKIVKVGVGFEKEYPLIKDWIVM